MFLFFDTETTGLPKNWKTPVFETENWPHIVQLAWAVFDVRGKRVKFNDFLIYPDGFQIPEAATKVHGISDERARQEGKPIKEILNLFLEDAKPSKWLIGHNLDFDDKMIQVESFRLGLGEVLNGVAKICTMKSAADYCQLPGKYGYKWPTLSELHIKLFGTDFEGQHNAASDMLCSAKCFFELVKRGVIL